MSILLANNYTTTLSTGIDNSTTTIPVSSVTGLPAIGSGSNCYITVQEGSTIEIMLATAVAALNITATRAQQGTSASSFTSAATVEIRATRDNFKPESILDSKAITTTTIATDDKVIVQDTSDSDKIKTITTQAIADLSSATKTATTKVVVGGNATAAGYIELLEDTDNGANKVTLTAPQSIASDKTVTLQDVTGTVYVSNGTDVAIADGGTGVSAVTTAPTASSFAGWDSNSNLSANNMLKGYTSTATAAGTTTLTVASTSTQIFTGSTTETVTLPVVSTLALGTSFTIVNLSSGVVTVQSSGANSIQAMQANSTLVVISNATSGTNAAVWYVVEYSAAASGQTGTGSLVRATSPTFVTPLIGTPTSGVLTNCTGLPASGLAGQSPVIQRVYTQTGTMATGTGAIPFDNTIPQISEGTEFMTLAITPTNASNILEIKVGLQFSANAVSNIIWALFKDATANALSSAWFSQTIIGAVDFGTLTHTMVAGTTSSTTFRVRIGATAGATLTFNGYISASHLGGSLNSNIVITEYQA